MFALIEPARTEDVEPVLALLRDNHLPADGDPSRFLWKLKMA